MHLFGTGGEKQTTSTPDVGLLNRCAKGNTEPNRGSAELGQPIAHIPKKLKVGCHIEDLREKLHRTCNENFKIDESNYHFNRWFAF